jgi:hypothetical protein
MTPPVTESGGFTSRSIFTGACSPLARVLRRRDPGSL